MDTHYCEDVRLQLQRAVGETPVVTAEPFVNLFKTRGTNYVLAVRPRTLDEVQRVVRAASLIGLRVRPIGSSHSWSPLYPDEGQVALYTSHLTRHDGPRMELTQVHLGHYELTAMCNVTTGELRQYQIESNVEIPSSVLIESATVAGIIATTSHGSGPVCAKSVGNQVVRMRIIDGSGNLRSLDQTSDPDIMNAARGSLGLFGVVYDVTFQARPGTLDITTDTWLPASEVFYNTESLRQIIFGCDYLQLFWFPMSSLSGSKGLKVLFRKHLFPGEWNPAADSIWVRTGRTAPPGATLKGRKVGPQQTPQSNLLYSVARSVLKRVPSAIPLIVSKEQNNFKKVFNGSVVQEHANAVHFLSGLDAFEVLQMEFVFNLDLEAIRIAFEDLRDELLAYGLQGRFPISSVVEMRVTQASDLFMAPGYISNCSNGGSGYSVHLDLVSVSNTPHYYTFAAKIARHWMSKFHARPHWGKLWSFIPDIHTYLQQTLSREFSLFRRALESSNIDPCRTFFNSTLECLLYSGTPPPQLGSSCGHCVQAVAVKQVHHPALPCCQDHSHSHNPQCPVYAPHPQPCTQPPQPQQHCTCQVVL